MEVLEEIYTVGGFKKDILGCWQRVYVKEIRSIDRCHSKSLRHSFYENYCETNLKIRMQRSTLFITKFTLVTKR